MVCLLQSLAELWGKDNIVLATTLKYQSGLESIECSVQDAREAKWIKKLQLLQRNIAIKNFWNADAIAIEAKMTAAKTYKLSLIIVQSARINRFCNPVTQL
jgi:hypothetical protein